MRDTSRPLVSLDEVAPDDLTNALRYALTSLAALQVKSEEEQIKAALVKAGIPLPDPSWPIEQQKAHLALHCPPDFKVAIPRPATTAATAMANLPATSPELLQKLKDAVAKLPAPRAPLPGTPGTFQRRW